MIARIWRASVAICDWRTLWRKLTGQPEVDVVFISNMRDDVDRKRYLGSWHPSEGHFNGPRYWLNGKVSGRTRALDITTDEMHTEEGRAKAREQFLAATRWAEAKGARVVLLAASTKRLFEYDHAVQLKERFPNMSFTIGDNGTFLLLQRETLRALNKAGLKPGFCRIGILGPYGFLGRMMTRTLKGCGYDIIGAGPNCERLEEVAKEYGIAVCKTFSEMGKVDAIIACTHSDDISLTADSIELIRREDKKLLVVDVAEPANLRYREYQKCRQFVIRQDAGNGYAKGLKYILGAISYRMFRLTRGVTFGCFAETLVLAAALKNGEDVGKIDWLVVNDENMERVSKLFLANGFTIPSPRCFSKPVNSFVLNLRREQEHHFSWKVAREKLASLLF